MERLKELLEQNKEEYIRYLKELVAIDTHCLGHGIAGGLEKEGQEYMIRLFQAMNADRIKEDPLTEETILKCLNEYQEGNPGHNQENRFNVYATFKGNGGRSLLFNGHIDTMPAGNEKEWKYPPHQPTIKDGKLYGLGSTDMKGGLLASVMAVKLLKDAGIPLPGDVTIASVCDEEGGGNGSIQAIMSGERADGVVVCEGTSDELIVAHMGFVFFRVEIEGKACQSGVKWRGVSAIDKAMKLIRELDEMEHRWLLTYKHPLLPAPNLNVGTIKGGTAGSTVAGKCQFEVCIHYIPKQMSHNQVVAEFMDVINRISDADPWLKDHKPVVTMYQAGGAYEMEEHPFVDSFREAYKKAREKEVKLVGSPAGCDSRLWRNIAKCPTIQFGPGNLEQCHAVNEYLSLDAYLQSILVYATLILSWGSREK